MRRLGRALAATLMMSACAGPGATTTRGPVGDDRAEVSDALHTLPWGLAPGAYLKGVDRAPHRSASAFDVQAGTRAAAGKPPSDTGTPHWFFYQFDRNQLIFLVTHYQPNPQRGALPGGWFVVDYVAQVSRTPRSVELLGLGEKIAAYEVGVAGIKHGWTPPKSKPCWASRATCCSWVPTVRSTTSTRRCASASCRSAWPS